MRFTLRLVSSWRAPLGLWGAAVPGLVVIWLWSNYGLLVVFFGAAMWLWRSGYWRDVWQWAKPRLARAWAGVKRTPGRLSRYVGRRARAIWGSALKRLHLRDRQGPGWLSYEIHPRMAQAERSHRPPRMIRSRLAMPSRETLMILAGLLVFLIALSWGLTFVPGHVSALPPLTQRVSVFTTMWQVQAGIAALALPVLTFVIERARDDQQAAAPSAEVLGRESWSFLIIGFSFVVVARMGIDLAFWPNKSLGVCPILCVGVVLC